jgi:hypothetical protein
MGMGYFPTVGITPQPCSQVLEKCVDFRQVKHGIALANRAVK